VVAHVAQVVSNEGHTSGTTDALKESDLLGAQATRGGLDLDSQELASIQLAQDVGAANPAKANEAPANFGYTGVLALTPCDPGMVVQGGQHFTQRSGLGFCVRMLGRAQFVAQ
jgi:hypothetical protein